MTKHPTQKSNNVAKSDKSAKATNSRTSGVIITSTTTSAPPAANSRNTIVTSNNISRRPSRRTAVVAAERIRSQALWTEQTRGPLTTITEIVSPADQQYTNTARQQQQHLDLHGGYYVGKQYRDDRKH